MSDLLALLGVSAPPPRAVPRRRCEKCHRWVAVKNAVAGHGSRCAEQRGLVVRRWRLRAPPQTGPDLLTTLPTEEDPLTLTTEHRAAIDGDPVHSTSPGSAPPPPPSPLVFRAPEAQPTDGAGHIVLVRQGDIDAAVQAGASNVPVLASARIPPDLYPPTCTGALMTRTASTITLWPARNDHDRDLLVTWARANNLDPATVIGNRGVAVHLVGQTITFSEFDEHAVPPDPNAAPSRHRTVPLLASPSDELIAACGIIHTTSIAAAPRTPGRRRRGVVVITEGELARALRLPDGQRVLAFKLEPLRVAIAVLVEGDGLPEVAEYAEASTINSTGDDTPLCFVPGRLSPAQEHEQVLDALDHRFRLEHKAVTDGRRRILERHAPYAAEPGHTWCSHCTADTTGPDGWPCADYRDAAADLVIWPATAG